jgi:hypothetical protein
MNPYALAHSAILARQRLKQVDPLKAFSPTPVFMSIYRDIANARNLPSACEILLNGTNKGGKTMGIAAFFAAVFTGRTDLEWMPELPAEWLRWYTLRLIGADREQLRLDVLSILAYFLPAYAGSLLDPHGPRAYRFSHGELSIVTWLNNQGAARTKLEGVKPMGTWFNEMGPFELWTETIARNPDGKPLLVQTATTGLATKGAERIDLGRWRERAQRGEPCEHPEVCHHPGERIPGVYHHWIDWSLENVPWMTTSAFNAHILRIPAMERAVRLGRSWETIPEGKYWPLFSEAQQVKPFTLGDIVATCERLRQGVGSPTVTLAVATDCGYADHQASVLEAWYHAPCPACITMGQHRGKVRCGTCRGRGGACTPCLGSGKIACYTCNETGGQWYRWTLSDHKSKGGHLDKRPHNVAGILQMLVEAGVSTPGVAGPVAAGKMIDVFVADNQTAGQGDMTWQTEAEAIASLTGMPRHVPAYKVASERTQIEEGNALLQHERWVIHPRCVNVIAAMSAARWQPNGAPMRHDEAGSDTRAAIRYSGNHFLLRSPLKINRG